MAITVLQEKESQNIRCGTVVRFEVAETDAASLIITAVCAASTFVCGLSVVLPFQLIGILKKNVFRMLEMDARRIMCLTTFSAKTPARTRFISIRHSHLSSQSWMDLAALCLPMGRPIAGRHLQCGAQAQRTASSAEQSPICSRN